MHGNCPPQLQLDTEVGCRDVEQGVTATALVPFPPSAGPVFQGQHQTFDFHVLASVAQWVLQVG